MFMYNSLDMIFANARRSCQDLGQLVPRRNNFQSTRVAMKVFGRLKNTRSHSPTKEAKESKRRSADEPHLSDLSQSSSEDIEHVDSIGDNSEDFERFERQLRHKHAKACKAMSVGILLCRYLLVI